jgi:hypothetical protein
VGLVTKWTSEDAAEEVRVAILACEPLPVTGSFLNASNKDAIIYGDMRAGLCLPVHFIPSCSCGRSVSRTAMFWAAARRNVDGSGRRRPERRRNDFG